jgi:hypothetical protein
MRDNGRLLRRECTISSLSGADTIAVHLGKKNQDTMKKCHCQPRLWKEAQNQDLLESFVSRLS